MIQKKARVPFSFPINIAFLFVSMLIACGCRQIDAIGPEGAVDAIEHGRILSLEIVALHHSSFMGGEKVVLTEHIPSLSDHQAVQKLANEPRPYRRRYMFQNVIAYLRLVEGYPWRYHRHWAIGTDPLVLGIGKKGPTDIRNPNDRTLYPFIYRDANDETISAVVIFPPGSWAKLRHINDRADFNEIPYRVISLPSSVSLREAIEKKPWENQGDMGQVFEN